MRITVTVIFFIASAFRLAGQDSLLTFRVRDPDMEIMVFPSDSCLWTEQPNPLNIRIKGEKKIGGVFLKGGRLYGADTSYVIWVNERAESALLTIYEILPDGSKAVCFTKKYSVKKTPQPVIRICGVEKDSVMDLWDLHIRNSITAQLKDQKKYIPILSFSMVYIKNGKSDTLSAIGNKFNLTMREELFRLKPGSTLTVCNIEVMYPGGKKKILEPVQIFLAETGKRRVGY